jgi:type II secretion system protein G
MKKGFTLIELLITIAIIGILSAIIGIAMVNPQKEARDAKRKSDLELIRSGLEIYNADCGSYPLTAAFTLPSTTSLVGSGASADCSASTSYIGNVPVDPTSGRNYYYVSTGPTYFLCAALEMPPSPAVDVTGCGVVTNCGSNCNYEVKNP